MKHNQILIVVALLAVVALAYYVGSSVTFTKNTATPGLSTDTVSAIQTFLSNKYSRPPAEVKVTVEKESAGFAGGSVLFGQGGPGESGMWLAVSDGGWKVVWDGNGNVDCAEMRQQYGFPDSVLVPLFCN